MAFSLIKELRNDQLAECGPLIENEIAAINTLKEEPVSLPVIAFPNFAIHMMLEEDA